MCDLVLTQTTVSDGHRALASPSLLNSPAPVGRAVGCMVAGAGFGSEACIGAGAGAGAATGAGAGAATGAGAGAAIGAVDAVWPLRQDFRNCCQVWPLVVPFALAAFHWSPHCFITLSPAGAAAGAAATGAGAAAGAAAGAEARLARQDLRNSCQVWPLVALFALAVFHWSPHCFITLWASAAPVAAKPRAAATRNAENAALKDFFMSTPLRASLC